MRSGWRKWHELLVADEARILVRKAASKAYRQEEFRQGAVTIEKTGEMEKCATRAEF